MSRVYIEEFRNFELGDLVDFDGPYGERLRGRVARIYFGDGSEIHVQCDGVRYEVNVYQDNVQMVWED